MNISIEPNPTTWQIPEANEHVVRINGEPVFYIWWCSQFELHVSLVLADDLVDPQILELAADHMRNCECQKAKENNHCVA